MTAIDRCFGLTGGIGSGKSTVSQIFAQLGAEIIDADKLTRIVHGDTSIIEQLVSAFGSSILDNTSKQPKISRPRLAQQAFAQPSGVQQLNAIMQPALRHAAETRLHAANKPVVLDAALLFEAGWDTLVGTTIAVLCPISMRFTRVAARDNLPKSQIEARMAAQMSDAERAIRADIIIFNTGSMAQLQRQAKIIFEKKLARCK
ncbi:MAG: dephospho-CoA kinase [Proteobacteria bacterium]|nr:dephospho-CoA kinase [Pseudomonadota bacterium]